MKTEAQIVLSMNAMGCK